MSAELAAFVRSKMTEFRQSAGRAHEHCIPAGAGSCGGGCGFDEVVHFLAVVIETTVDEYMECTYAPAGTVKPEKLESLRSSLEHFATIWEDDGEPSSN